MEKTTTSNCSEMTLFIGANEESFFINVDMQVSSVSLLRFSTEWTHDFVINITESRISAGMNAISYSMVSASADKD